MVFGLAVLLFFIWKRKSFSRVTFLADLRNKNHYMVPASPAGEKISHGPGRADPRKNVTCMAPASWAREKILHGPGWAGPPGGARSGAITVS